MKGNICLYLSVAKVRLIISALLYYHRNYKPVDCDEFIMELTSEYLEYWEGRR